MSEPSISDDASENSKDVLNEKRGNFVHIINVNRNTCRKASIEEILNPGIINLIDEEYIFLIIDPSTESISKIRKAHNLHPILDYECSVTNSYSIDHMFKFDDCLFLSLIDIPVSENLLQPSSLKILLMKSVMFVIAPEKLDCIEEVFGKDMGFVIGVEEGRSLVTRASQFLMTNRAPRRSAIQVSPDTTSLTKLELVLYKIMHVMFLRMEDIIEKMDKEVLVCIDFVYNLTVGESNEFIIRINRAQKDLSLCKTFATRKANLFPELIKTKFLSKTFSEYLKSMSLNMNKLEKKVVASKKMLTNHENVYNSYVDEGISQSSKRQNRLLQIFAAFTTIFLPLNLIGAFMGMNVRVPYQGDLYPTLWPFNSIIVFCGCYLIFIVVLFKSKSWL